MYKPFQLLVVAITGDLFFKSDKVKKKRSANRIQLLRQLFNELS